MRHNTLCRAWSVFAAVLLASPLYAEGNEPTQTDATSTLDCQRYSGGERTDCERRMSQTQMSQERMEEDQWSAESATATPGDSEMSDSSRSTTTSDRTRVSHADTERAAEDERSTDESRANDPGEAQGADMRSAPNPDYDRADDDLSDPYEAGPATETGSDRSTSPQGQERN